MLKKIHKRILNKYGSVSGFAEEVGVRQATLSEFLSGKRDIRVSTLKSIIEPLGMDLMEVKEELKK